MDTFKREWAYATLPAAAVFGITDATERPAGSYLSDDADARAYRNLLAAGYRWVRTDGEVAVFEKRKELCFTTAAEKV